MYSQKKVIFVRYNLFLGSLLKLFFDRNLQKTEVLDKTRRVIFLTVKFVCGPLSKLFWDRQNNLKSLFHISIRGSPYSTNFVLPENYTIAKIVLQGQPSQSYISKLALTDRNVQAKFCFKVVLESWDWIFLGITTSFCEMLTVPSIGPNVSHPQFHLVFL